MMVPIFNLQIYGDPEAADVVFTSGANITVVGINITTQVKLTGETAVYNLFLFLDQFLLYCSEFNNILLSLITLLS